MALRDVNPGFDSHNILTMRMSLTGPRFLKSSGVEQMVRDGVERLGALPGVELASATCCVPLQGGLRPAVHDRRTTAAMTVLSWRRRLDHGVARFLRGVQDPGQAWPLLQHSR